MFTGIIQQVGTIKDIKKKDGGLRIAVALPRMLKGIRLGSSVAVSGVCLTVANKRGKTLWFDVMGETIKKTTLGTWAVGRNVNIEPSLHVGDEVGGHFVFGHVDTIQENKKTIKQKSNTILMFGMTKEIKKYIVPQGSVAIDGVSLTVARVGKMDFSVSLVEYTLTHTTLQFLKAGDAVNVECDMLAKYITNKR